MQTVYILKGCLKSYRALMLLYKNPDISTNIIIVDEFYYKVFGYDVYHENLLCKLKSQKEIELVLIDGLGITIQSNTIKSQLAFLVNYSDYLAKKRIEKIFHQLSNILDLSNDN